MLFFNQLLAVPEMMATLVYLALVSLITDFLIVQAGHRITRWLPGM